MYSGFSSHFDALDNAVIHLSKFSLGKSNYLLGFGTGHLPIKESFFQRSLQWPMGEWGPRSQAPQLVLSSPENCCLVIFCERDTVDSCLLPLEVEQWVLWKSGYTAVAYRKEQFSPFRISQPSLSLEMVRHLGCIWIFYFIPLWRSCQWCCLNSDQGNAGMLFFEEGPQELDTGSRPLLLEHLVSLGQHPKFQAKF